VRRTAAAVAAAKGRRTGTGTQTTGMFQARHFSTCSRGLPGSCGVHAAWRSLLVALRGRSHDGAAAPARSEPGPSSGRAQARVLASRRVASRSHATEGVSGERY